MVDGYARFRCLASVYRTAAQTLAASGDCRVSSRSSGMGTSTCGRDPDGNNVETLCTAEESTCRPGKFTRATFVRVPVSRDAARNRDRPAAWDRAARAGQARRRLARCGSRAHGPRRRLPLRGRRARDLPCRDRRRGVLRRPHLRNRFERPRVSRRGGFIRADGGARHAYSSGSRRTRCRCRNALRLAGTRRPTTPGSPSTCCR